MHTSPDFVVLVSADAEWRVVRNYFRNKSVTSSPVGEWFYHRFPSLGEATHTVIFIHGGWGKVAAAASTQFVVDMWHPQLIINLGTCGGFAGKINCGDIILVERTIIYDIYEQMGDPEEHIQYFSTDIDTAWIREPLPVPVIRSLLVSADRDLLGKDLPMLSQKYGAIAGDWESGAIAWVADKNDTACFILRGVTDLVGEEGGEAYDGNVDYYYQNTVRVMKTLLDALPDWLLKYIEYMDSIPIRKADIPG